MTLVIPPTTGRCAIDLYGPRAERAGHGAPPSCSTRCAPRLPTRGRAIVLSGAAAPSRPPDLREVLRAEGGAPADMFGAIYVQWHCPLRWSRRSTDLRGRWCGAGRRRRPAGRQNDAAFRFPGAALPPRSLPGEAGRLPGGAGRT